MPRGSQLTTQDKEIIVKRKEEGYSNADIARILGKDPSTISRFWAQRLNVRRKRSGRPRKLNEMADHQIWREADHKAVSCREIMDTYNLDVSRQTLWRSLKRCPFLTFKKNLLKPPLTVAHCQARVDWCTYRLAWTEEWKTYIFSDEKKFNLDGPDGWAFYWCDSRRPEAEFAQRQSGGGSVMIWAAIGWNGRSQIALIDTTMNSEVYTDLLRDYLLPCLHTIAVEPVVFQQDNAAIHASRHTQGWLVENNVPTTLWPSKSPDLNPIKNLWGTLARKVYRGNKQYSNKVELREAISEAWTAITQEEIQHLYDTMPRRCIKVIEADGKAIKY